MTPLGWPKDIALAALTAMLAAAATALGTWSAEAIKKRIETEKTKRAETRELREKLAGRS